MKFHSYIVSPDFNHFLQVVHMYICFTCFYKYIISCHYYEESKKQLSLHERWGCLFLSSFPLQLLRHSRHAMLLKISYQLCMSTKSIFLLSSCFSTRLRTYPYYVKVKICLSWSCILLTLHIYEHVATQESTTLCTLIINASQFPILFCCSTLFVHLENNRGTFNNGHA